nr:MAG TPA: hypothetical protein [Caudoviricetes sp.]
MWRLWRDHSRRPLGRSRQCDGPAPDRKSRGDLADD